MSQAAPAAGAFNARFRAFNRFYTRVIGTLQKGYLDTPHTVQEARVLFEVASGPGVTATEIRERTGIDQGHLSRILARLEDQGLLRRNRSKEDGRAHHLHPTAAGRRAFETLNARADAQAAALTAHLGPPAQEELLGALGTVERLLRPGDAAPPVTLRTHRGGDLGWLLERHAVVYAEEFGYSDVFERYVAESFVPFLAAYDPSRDRLWIAEADGRRLGAIAIQHAPERPGWAKLRWFLVEKGARGRGVGRALLTEALGFSRIAGYEGIFLGTVNDLHAARKLYEQAGFRLVEETQEPCPWAPWGREQKWELRLR